MFDIGFSELLVIAVVALIVLGPERLPKAARFAGLWVRRAREAERQFEDVRQAVRDDAKALREDVESAITPPALARPPVASPDPAPAIEEEGRLASTTDTHDDAAADDTHASDVGTTADLFPTKEPR